MFRKASVNDFILFELWQDFTLLNRVFAKWFCWKCQRNNLFFSFFFLCNWICYSYLCNWLLHAGNVWCELNAHKTDEFIKFSVFNRNIENEIEIEIFTGRRIQFSYDCNGDGDCDCDCDCDWDVLCFE